MDINCDLGEWETAARTRALMGLIDSANIACGGHAGNISSMERCILLAMKNQVKIGAHPGFADQANAGRKEANLTHEAFLELLVPQVATLQILAKTLGAKLHHVKLHGALYHWSEQPKHANWYLAAMGKYFPGVKVFALAGGTVQKSERMHEVEIWGEAFADRGYLPGGKLVPRGAAGALVTDPALVKSRVASLIGFGKLQSVDGSLCSIAAKTICIHGDTPDSLCIAKVVRDSSHPGKHRLG